MITSLFIGGFQCFKAYNTPNEKLHTYLLMFKIASSLNFGMNMNNMKKKAKIVDF